MNDPWLVLDVSYLCHRAFHTMGQLSHRDVKTGVIYGFMRDVVEWQDRFGTDRVAFCFDLGRPLRKDIYAGYKEKRHSKPLAPEQRRARLELERQIQLLRSTYLPMVGWRNIFAAEGYEGDDIIAALICDESFGEDPVIVVSADSDLYQLLDFGDVRILRPAHGEIVTEGTFRKKYGIHPQHWAMVKAMAGCSSDEVPGIPGVGERTAIKWLLGQLKSGSVAHRAIEAGASLVKRNLRLVELPLRGTPAFEVTYSDGILTRGWQKMCRELGFKSLIGRHHHG